MLKCIDLAMSYAADKPLFSNVNLSLVPKHRYAIVGANGAGKSTLLKILAGEEESTDGVIEKPNGTTIGVLKQDHFRYQHHAVIDVVLEGKPELVKCLHEKAVLLEKPDLTEEECYRIAELEETIMHLDGYSAQSQAEKILTGLGLSSKAQQGQMSALSGGFKLRVLLAQALFQQPDILLLDEPTNHLDIISIAWLESFLINDYNGLLIFISHDRGFINNIATHILDIDYAAINVYPGNFEKFLAKKAEVQMQKEQELANKQDKIAAMQSYVDRFGASANRARQAQSRLKMIERIEEDLPEMQASSRRQPHFVFKQTRAAGKEVLRVKNLAKSFPDKFLFNRLHLILQRGEKCALIGPNGIGKTTLLRMLLQQIPADNGEITWSENASIGVFAQDFHEALQPEKTLLEWLHDQVSHVSESSIRKMLGQMLFSGDSVHKKIRVLSGGECARLVLAKLMLEQHNVLILDEPTNHLDMEAIDGLIEGLRHFQGTILCVSHQRYFIQQVTQSLLIILPNRTEYFHGTYEEYLAKNGKDYLLRIYAEAH